MVVHNQADDIAELSRAVAQLFRVVLAGSSPSAFAGAAKAAGLSAAQSVQFMDGTFVPPPRQGVTFVNAVLEAARAARASYLGQIRQGSAGSLWRAWPAETTMEAVDAALAALRKDFGDWSFPVPDGVELLGGEKPAQLAWTARHPEWPQVRAGTAGELRANLEAIEAHMKAEADLRARYADGRGVTQQRRTG